MTVRARAAHARTIRPRGTVWRPSGQTAPQGSPTTTGKLTQVTSSLLVQVDGADTACPCFWVGPTQTVSVGQRVQVTVRRPRAPLVQVLS